MTGVTTYMEVAAILGLALPSGGGARLTAVGDLSEDCPAQCSCNRSVQPHVACRGLMSLPRFLPSEARSFLCADCPLARVVGGALRSYAGLENISLAGDSRLVLDERSLEVLGGVPVLELRGYSLAESDFLRLARRGYLVVRDVSLVSPGVPARTSASKFPSPGTTDSSSPDTTDSRSPATTDYSRPGSTDCSGPGTTDPPSPGTTDNRSMGGGCLQAATPSPTLSPVTIGVMVLVGMVLVAAFSSLVTWVCVSRKTAGRDYRQLLLGNVTKLRAARRPLQLQNA
ncbi:uncharacterized protein LOC134531405 [Bacillus rossius redtenbacheri]|uniref:uncharacterized protein LOC134531405 n=1 Tax=Bacillus rossius redtenbacheri TaxID=93214 RepID=UPI002FDD1661